MNTVLSPFEIAIFSTFVIVAYQLGTALLRRNLNSLRDSHYWLNHPSIRRITPERDIRRLSAFCLPGGWAVVGGLPQALAISLTYATMVAAFHATWWGLLLVPVVYEGTHMICGEILRRCVSARLKRRVDAATCGAGGE